MPNISEVQKKIWLAAENTKKAQPISTVELSRRQWSAGGKNPTKGGKIISPTLVVEDFLQPKSISAF